MRPVATSSPAPSRLRAVLVRTAGFAALWWVLAEGELRGWALALASIAAAVLASLALVPPGHWRWRPRGLLRFLPFFLWQSVRGGADVARRALHPGLPIRPGFLLHPLQLPQGPARTFFAATVGLLPGTLSTELRDGQLRVHALDERLPIPETLRRLEAHVAELFGVSGPNFALPVGSDSNPHPTTPRRAIMSSINRPLTGPLLTFDLQDQLAELRREESYERSGRAGRTLAKSGRLRLVLVAMATGNVIGTHQADSPMTIHILHGHIRFRADDGDHELREGQVLFFGPGDAHDIRALEESALLLTLSAIGDDYN